MQKIQLNSRELLYIASFLDVDEFYGVSDGFYGMDEADISSEINNIKNSLNDKGYAEMDFDGNFNIKSEIMDIIRVCVEQDRYIAFDKVQNGAISILRIYIKDNKVVKFTGDNINYTVEEININLIKTDLISFVNWTEEKTYSEEKENFIENEFLLKVKGMSEFDNPEQELKLMGCSSIKSKILYGGLTGQYEYYSLIVIDFLGVEQDVHSLIFINSSNGILQITPDLDSEKEGVQLSVVCQMEISQKINDAVSQCVPEAVEEFI